jgi:hypothetical protein
MKEVRTMRRFLVFGIVFCMFATLSQGCNEGHPKYHPGGPYYYKSYAHYLLPYRPVDEISVEEVKKAEEQSFAYYEAHFNNEGYITNFKKHYRGKAEFEVRYYYENGILRKSESLDSKGQIKTDTYDAKGEIIKP